MISDPISEPYIDMNQPLYFSPLLRRLLVAGVFLSLSLTGNIALGRVVSPYLTGKTRAVSVSQTKDGPLRQQEESRFIPLIIKLSDPDATLPSSVVELYRRGPFVLAYVPRDIIEEISALGVVSRLEGGQVCVPVLDQARLFTGFPEIAAASGLPMEYTGKGVVTGFTDTGFDPNHPAFRDPATGKSRVALLTDYGLSPDEMVRLETPEEIAGWDTDDSEQWHATHVAGIMAGGYKGNPYQGIATESEIVATTSALYDALLLAGMEDVVGYARKVGKPAVINMSVSASLGPHDGTSLFCQYLELLSKEATICISAGNDGFRVGSLDGVFPNDCSTAASVFDILTWDPAKSEGYIDVWSDNSMPFGLAVIVIDLQNEKVVAREEFPAGQAGNPEWTYTIGSSTECLSEAGADSSTGSVSSEFARYLKGIMTVTTEINPENGRFNALAYLKVENLPEADGQLSQRYLVGLEISGKKGQKVNAYTSENFRFREVPEYQKFVYIGGDGTINDFVTGKGVIGVGAMCSRNRWPQLNGEEGVGYYDYKVGEIAQFSSFSTRAVNGRLPDIDAPGAWLVSSVSTPYMESHPGQIPTASVAENIDGRDYYWKYACGTSMSSPYVAGICALWLQADPEITSSEIKETMLATAVAPTIDPANPRWGRGVLDSYEGLRSIVSGAGVGTVRQDRVTGDFPPLPSPLTGESLMDYARCNSCEVYNVGGMKITSGSPGPGVYILRKGGASLKVAL